MPSRSQIFTWIAILLTFSVEPAFADSTPDCGPLYAGLRTISDDLANAFQDIQKISPALASGEKTPGWDDFNALQKIITEVKNGKKAATDSGKLTELQSVIADIEKSLPDNPSLVALRDASKDAHPLPKYLPGEYELKLQYQQLIWELDRELPEELKIPGVRLPHDTRIKPLIAQATSQLTQQKQRFTAFFPNTGFANISALKTALQNYSSDAKSLVDLLDTENVELAMNRPEEARWWTPRVGFQNQRITGTSKGTLDPDFRNNVEAKMMGLDPADYVKTDDQLKPQYGYLKPTPSASLKQSNAANAYGGDVYIFKKSNVRNRLTFTSGDSFGPAEYAPVSPGASPQNWRGFFIPWEDRLLIVPDILENVTTAKQGFTAAQIDSMERFFPDFPKQPTPPAGPAYPTMPPPPAGPDLPPLPEMPPAPTPIALPDPPPPPPEPLPLSPEEEPKMPIHGTSLPMPELKEGEKFDDALNALINSDANKALSANNDELDQEYRTQVQLYQVKANAYAAKLQEYRSKTLVDYQNSDAYKAYQVKIADIQKQNNDALEAYQSGPYDTWMQKYSEVNMKQMSLTATFQQSEVYKTYLAEWQKISNKYYAASNAFSNSDAYKAYQAASETYRDAYSALTNTDKFKWYQYNLRINPNFGLRGTSLEPLTGPTANGYIELQYWGPVTLDDVETFEFRGTPPSGDFLAELIKRKIKIRDGRVDPAIPWTPEK